MLNQLLMEINKEQSEAAATEQQQRLLSLRAAIEKENKSLQVLAEKCGIGYRHFAYIVHGDRPITDAMKARIETGLNIVL